MKVRCPHCKAVFPISGDGNARACPECNRTVLLPRFFGDAGHRNAAAHSAILQRNALRRRQQAAGGATPAGAMLFMKRPMRIFFLIALLLVVGGGLLRRARDPRELGEDARIGQALRNLATLRVAVDRFKRDCGRYPSTEEGLAALILDPDIEGWSGPYILRLPPDPWRRAYLYALEDGRPVITSLGADGIEGTEHDLRYREATEPGRTRE